MLSRVAERLYWFARYIERSENTARLLLVRHQLVLDLPMTMQPGWDLLLDVLGARELFASRPGKAIEKNVVSFVYGDRNNPCSIKSSVAFARENMRTTREVMPSETWERVNSLYLSVTRRAGKDLPRGARDKVLNDIIQRCQQITGMLAGCMNEEDGYFFVRLGRNLERADMSTRIIDVGSAQLLGDSEEIQPYRNTLWINVLKSLSAYQMYHLNAHRNVQADAVLAFLIKSKVFPRALAHALAEMGSSVARLPRNKDTLKVIAAVEQRLEQTNPEQLSGAALHGFLDAMQIELQRIHTSIHDTWFAPAGK